MLPLHDPQGVSYDRFATATYPLQAHATTATIYDKFGNAATLHEGQTITINNRDENGAVKAEAHPTTISLKPWRLHRAAPRRYHLQQSIGPPYPHGRRRPGNHRRARRLNTLVEHNMREAVHLHLEALAEDRRSRPWLYGRDASA